MEKEAFKKLAVEAIKEVLGVGNSIEQIVESKDAETQRLFYEVALKSYEDLLPKLENILKEIDKEIESKKTKH